MDSRVEDNERRYRAAIANNNKLELWYSIEEACKNQSKWILSKSCIHLSDDTFIDRLTTAITNVYERIQKGVIPNRLGSYCYWFCVGAFQGSKAVKEDREYSYEQSVEAGYDIPVDILGRRIYDLQ